MRSHLFAGAAALATLLVACNPTNLIEDPKALELRGAYDMVRVQIPAIGAQAARDHLYVLSSEKDQLHIIDLTNDAKRDYVRAPNPIEPLAIPVLRQPTQLAADLRYGPAGTEIGGPFVYAYNPASAGISIVDAREAQLREVFRLPTSAPVTAVAARGRENGASTLYYAVRDGAGARLYAIDLPMDGNYSTLVEPATPLLTVANESIATMVVLPPVTETSTDESLAIGTRGAGTAGSAFLYDRVDGSTRPLEFPAPVRMLRAHGATLQVASQIFGILDETSCNAGDACRGIVAVSRVSGLLLNDATGRPMLPIINGDAIPISMTLVPNGVVGATERTLLGIVTYSTGVITAFDGVRLQFIDGDPRVPFIGTFPDVEDDDIRYLDAAGEELADVPDGLQLTSVTLVEGFTRSELVAVAYEGRLPGLDRLPLDPAAPVPTTYTFDAAYTQPCPEIAPGVADPDPDRCVRVRTGDVVVLGGACTEELEILSVGAGTLTTSAPSTACTSASTWTVRARGARPFVVNGTVSGFMGRAQPNAVFRFYGAPFYRPSGFVPTSVSVQFSLGGNPPGIARDHRYVFQTASALLPLWFSFASGSSTPLGFDYNPFPAAVVYRCSGAPVANACLNASVKRLYLSFPALPDNTNENVGWVVEYDAGRLEENALAVIGELFP